MKILFKRFFKIIFLINILVLASSLDLQAKEIFINTNPINSRVLVDSKIIGRTPVRIKIEDREKIEIQIKKEGYKVLKKSVILKDKDLLNLHFDLVPAKIEITFKEDGKVINICGLPVGETPAVLYNIPNGVYKIEKNNNGYNINPAEYKYAIRSTAIESIYSGGFLTLFLLGMNDLNNKGNTVGTNTLGLGSAIMGCVLGYDLMKILKLKISEEKNRIEVKKIRIKPYQKNDDKLLFTEGVGFIGQKKYGRAIEKFSLLTKLYDDSQYIPISYYELGYCYYNLKNYRSAALHLRKFLYNYPIYEMYQYAFYYYLDSLTKIEKYNQAYKDYQDFKPSYIDDESGSLYKMYFNSLIDLYTQNESVYRVIPYDIVRYIDHYLKKYPSSRILPNIMMLKAKVLYKYLDRKEGLNVLNKIKLIYGKDQKIMKQIESFVEK